MLKKILYIIVVTVFSSFYASADTTDQKWMKKVEVTKSGGFSPYCSVATWYLWRSIDPEPIQY